MILETSLPNLTPKRGKVRDIYDLGTSLLLVSTDRISAFDWILPTGIPDKGKVLNQLSAFWFKQLNIPNHFITANINEMPLPEGSSQAAFAGRSTLAKKCQIFPVECIVRGYLSGSGWKEYQKSGTICGIKLPAGLRESDKLPEPIFTPSTKAEQGHDENISFEQMTAIVDKDVAGELQRKSLDVFRQGSEHALNRGIIIADTKFEFGLLNNEIVLADEVMTPDSSRFWSASIYEPGRSQPSLDKQFVRDHLTASRWDKNSPPPELPGDIVEKTRDKYLEALQLLTGRGLME
jgi:phosphoribosylaminoimidazole-succinocarboxamide synthase